MLCSPSGPIFINESRTLKAKRRVIRPIVDGARRFRCRRRGRLPGSMATGLLGFAVVAGTASHAEDVIDAVDRFVWSRPDVEVLSMDRRWLE
jgi:uncharacterized protein YlxP (DUF503 family)